MPRAQRSRACQQCRDRRVKCDETPDFCAQCRRLGLACSGPITGAVLIDMTHRVMGPTRPRKKRIASAPSESVTEFSKHKGVVQVVSEPNVKAESDRPVTPSALVSIVPADRDFALAIRHQYKWPTAYQPSRAIPEALDLAFVSHFVQINQGVRSGPEIPFITHLPTLQERSSMTAMRLSIRAASMACYATVHKDTTILVDSYQWYIKSLNGQRQILARQGAQHFPSADAALIPIILGLYEVFAGTTGTGMWQHLAAAARIIQMRGPSNCQGVTFALFKAVRVSDAKRAIVMNEPSIFSGADWMTTPFIGQTSNAHHYLIDILFLIPACIRICNSHESLRRFFSSRLPADADLIAVRTRADELLRRLDHWAVLYPHLASSSTGPLIVSRDMTEVIDADSSLPDGSSLSLPSSFIDLSAATYHAARLVLLVLLIKVTRDTAQSTPASSAPFLKDPYPNALSDDAVASSKLILAISAHMESTHPMGFDFMRSVFPLFMVRIQGPGVEEQRVAAKTLERWGQTRGVAGLCAAWLNA